MASRRLHALGVAIVTIASGAGAACLDGDYAVDGPPLLSSPAATVTSDVVTIADRTVAIASGCPALRASVRATARGTVVRARWIACGTAERVWLRAVVNRSCGRMRGILTYGRGRRSVRRFVAQHDVACPAKDGACRSCDTNADCASGRYCAYAFGACAAPGVCLERPDACPLSFVAACGCDGMTYAGPCEAAQHGVGVAHAGGCERPCGGIAGVPCDAGQYCELPAGQCDGADLQGACIDLPMVCAQIYAPVCSCDGVTYANDCERRGHAVQKAHDGPCESPCDGCEPKRCGGIAGLPCDDGEFCDLPTGECQSADLQGTCTPLPKICPDLHAPVCACDGTTYANECERRMAGAQKAHDGPCGAKCATACDCEQSSPLPSWCSALACPACGCAWACEGGSCAVHVVTPPPPSACK